MMILRGIGLALTTALLAAISPKEDYAEPYRILKQANRSLDPSLAASAYSEDGALIFEYPGHRVETFKGRQAITGAFVRTFGQVDAGTPINIDFRFEPPGLAGREQSGVYRIDATAGGRKLTLYGRFSAKLVKQGRAWRFGEDRGMVATAADFDKLPDPSF